MWKFIQYILGIVYTSLGWAKETSDENKGRQLEQTDDLKASVKGDQDAAKTRQDVAALSDNDLDGELRDGSAHSK